MKNDVKVVWRYLGMINKSNTLYDIIKNKIVCSKSTCSNGCYFLDKFSSKLTCELFDKILTRDKKRCSQCVETFGKVK